MGFCKKCGTKIKNGLDLCSICQAVQSNDDRVDGTMEFDSGYIKENKAAAAFSYLGILVIVPLFCAKESKFARFHANQGLVLFVMSVAYSVAISFLSGMLLAVSWKFFSIIKFARLVGLVFPIMAVRLLCRLKTWLMRHTPLTSAGK